MPSYIPDQYLGLAPGSYTKVMLPWPAHLRPREKVELTKKGEA